MIVLIIFNKYTYYLNIIKYFKIFLSSYAMDWPICLNIAMSKGRKSLTILWSDEIWQTCPLVSGVGITG
jgi:hypothetical protein